MSSEFPKNIRKIGLFKPEVINTEGAVLYSIIDKELNTLDNSQVDELNKRLKKHLKKSGYNCRDAPLFYIPSINKGYSVIVGIDCISIYPPREKYHLTEHEFPEFKKFLGEIEKVLQKYPPK